MITVLVRHKINDYSQWRSVFDQSLEFRHKGGEQSCRIFRDPEDPLDLTLVFEWEDLKQAESFMNSEELRARMQKAGVVGKPEIHFMREIYTVRRSAAD